MSKLAIIFPREGPKSLNKAMVDISIKYYTGYFRKNNFLLQTMGDKSVETLCNKIEFLSILVTFPPFPPKQCWFFYFFDCTDHSAYTTLNWGTGGIRELMLEANKIEQMLNYRKASFPTSFSTTFVAHCRLLAKEFKYVLFRKTCLTD